MRALLAIGLTLLAIPLQAAVPNAEELRAVSNQTRSTAIESLRTLQRLVDTKTVREVGFETAAQLKEARLGQPILDFMIRLDELSSYEGQDPAELLHPTGQVVYPVTIKEQTRSSITLVQEAGRWRAISFGEPQRAEARSRVLEELGRKVENGTANAFQVRIPAMNAVFVGHEVNGTMMLTPTENLPDLGLRAGETMEARQVLERARPAALQIDPYLPR